MKAYSASKGNFLDQLGYPNLTLHKKFKTSFNPNLPFNYYCGNGNALDRMNQNISQHYVSKHDPQLIYTDTDSIINDNSDLSLETRYFFANKAVDKIIGYKLNTNKVTFESSDQGLTLSNPQTIETFKLSFPTYKNKKNKYFKRGSYFRTQLKQTYVLKIDIYTDQQQLNDITLEPALFNERYDFIKSKIEVTKTINNNQLVFNVTIDKISKNENKMYLYFNLIFNNCYEKMKISKIQVTPVTHTIGQSTKGYIQFDEDRYPLNDSKKPQLLKLKNRINNQHTLTFNNKKNPSTCFIFKQPAIEWQIRNGTGNYINGNNKLQVNPKVHNYNALVETIITPMTSKQLYVNRCTIKNPISILFVSKNHIKLTCRNKNDLVDFTFYSLNPPSKITGARILNSGTYNHTCLPDSNVIEIWV